MAPGSGSTESEFDFWREILHNDEFARQITEADTDKAVSLLLQNHSKIIALKLWRYRTGDDLKAALESVDAIARRDGIEFD